MILTAILYKSNKMYVSKCVELDVVSQGHTVEDALENLKEAITLYLEEIHLDKKEIITNPIITTFEVNV